MKTALLKIVISLGLSLFFTWVYLFTPSVFYTLDNKLRDMMFVIRGELPKNHNVVIVDIDNKSLKKIGQWPWPRNQIAQLIENLTQAGAGIIGLDMIFSEPDRTSPHTLTKRYPEISQTLEDYDTLLAKTLAHAPVVGAYLFSNTLISTKEVPLLPAIFIQQGITKSDYITEPKGILLNIPKIQNALYSSGFFTTATQEGAMIRNTPLIKKYKGDIYSSLALEMVRIYSGAKKVYLIGDEYGIEYIHFGKFNIPTNNRGELTINYRGGQKHFKYLSASDVLQGDFNTSEVKGKFILLGTSAPGLKDLRATPFDNAYPGVEVHASIIDNILTADYISQPFSSRFYDILIIWGVVFVAMALFSFLKSQLILPVAMVVFALLLYTLYTILFHFGLLLGIFIPSMAFVVTLLASMGIDYIFTSKQKEEARRMLGKKVSPAVMQYLLEHANEDLVSPKETEATIFFSDIRKFTTISEQIGSPSALISMLNTYMTPMVETIVEHKGTIDKFIGDAIMAYWNVPIAVDNHADLAVQAAIKQITLLHDINQTLKQKYQIDIRIGIGLHTGIVIAGDMGSQGRSDYTVIGDTVNLASRIEGLTKVYGVPILISEHTKLQLKEDYTIRPIDIVEVKGKSQAVEIYEVIYDKKSVTPEELVLYKDAIRYFRRGESKKSLQLFTTLYQIAPCKLYKLYQERCAQFIAHPDTFSIIAKMTSK